jgi:hypothetical protein
MRLSLSRSPIHAQSTLNMEKSNNASLASIVPRHRLPRSPLNFVNNPYET